VGAVPDEAAAGFLHADDLILPALDRRISRIGGKLRKAVILALPAVVFEGDEGRVRARVRELTKAGYRRFLLGHIGQLALFDEGPEVRLYGDTTIPVLNSQAAATLLELGLETAAISLETDAANLTRLLSRWGGSLEWVVHARPTLFLSRVQVPGVKGEAAFEGARKSGRFLVRTGPQGSTVRAEAAVSASGVVDKRLLREPRAIRIQLGPPDLARGRLAEILGAVDRWQPVPRTTAFNLGRDRRLS
jgi:hypothetical protein